MSATYTAELAYSYRRAVAVLAGATITGPASVDSAALARIDALLTDAADAYNRRQYQDAIDDYQQVRTLLWKQLFPLTTLDETLAWSTDLLRTLVSYSAEWLNVLPVEQATAGVRPRELTAVDAPVVGLLSGATDAKATAAVADLQVSQTLQQLGNAASAKFFADRAASEAPDLIGKLTASPPAVPAQPAPPAPAPPQPGPPVPPPHIPPLGLPHTIPGGGFPTHIPAQPFSLMATSPALSASGLLAGAPSRIVTTPIDATIPVVVPPELTVAQRSYVFESAGAPQTLTWAEGQALSSDQVLGTLYNAHKVATVLPDVLIQPQTPADAAMSLAHAWYYETTLGLAQCYHALGQYSVAETWYLRAAGYQYLNATIEAPFVWSHLAQLYLDWGDSLFRDGDAQSALPIYENVLGAGNAVPTSQLYTTVGLKPAADAARTLIGSIAHPDAVDVSPAIASVILEVEAQLAKIAGGLDFWGYWGQNVPIWTFDYLQSVAVNFCQLAVGAERDAMNFWDRADAGTLTRTQLTQNIGLSQAELSAANQQVAAASAEAKAYQAAQQVAQLRADDASANATEYASKAGAWVVHQALQTQLSGGEDGDAGQLNQLADQMMSGSYSISGDRGTLAAAESLTAARLQNQYQIDTLNRQAAELNAAVGQAAAEVTAANAQVSASQASAYAASVRVQAAQQLLQAFDQQRFTPDVWNALGDRMNDLSQRYLTWALGIAKRMQSAYNFENDVDLQVIRPDYTSSEVHGLLASDTLMADIQSFTYDLVTSTAPKPQPLKQTISLSERYPFQFETQLRRTGSMDFQTDLDDFDSVYPGTYAGRIEHVEIAVDGIIPARGLSGSLTNAGISQYRTPSASGGNTKQRVQNRETQIISDFDVRADALVDNPDHRQLGIFQGAGLASTWTLALPKDVNQQLDFNTLVDVRLTFTYRARFDPDLRTAVLADLASRPGIHSRQRPFPLRWVFADAFFRFYSTGVLDFALAASDFALTEKSPVLTDASLVVATSPGSRAQGMTLKVTLPGSAPLSATTDADGVVQTTALASGVTGQSAIGAYRIELDAADNAGWVTNGALVLDDIDNIALVVGYSFTPRSLGAGHELRHRLRQPGTVAAHRRWRRGARRDVQPRPVHRLGHAVRAHRRAARSERLQPEARAALRLGHAQRPVRPRLVDLHAEAAAQHHDRQAALRRHRHTRARGVGAAGARERRRAASAGRHRRLDAGGVR